MRPDFAAFILTHGRPDNVLTYRTLRRQGYTGRIYLVVDDEDPALEDYRRRYPGEVLTFSKAAIAEAFDQGDNSTERRTVFYARNACWALADTVGARWFVELDDDYDEFKFRLVGRRPGTYIAGYHGWTMHGALDAVLEAFVAFLEATPAATIAMSQGGDHIGGTGGDTDVKLKRKAMNSFVCDASRPFPFRGRINEDVNTYVSLGNLGRLFFTYYGVQLDQTATQQADGGMSGVYRDGGTYVKSFYSVMFAPSCVRVEYMPAMRRVHHRIAWDNAVPKILHERHRKGVA